MSTEETAWQAGESAAAGLGPEAGVFASADAAHLAASRLVSEVLAAGGRPFR